MVAEEGDGLGLALVVGERLAAIFGGRYFWVGVIAEWRIESNARRGRLTVVTSHSRMDLSSEPEARILESGLHAMVDIPARWPSRVCASSPVFESQILIVASEAVKTTTLVFQITQYMRHAAHSQQLAIHRPSGENLTAATPFLCPRSIKYGW